MKKEEIKIIETLKRWETFLELSQEDFQQIKENSNIRYVTDASATALEFYRRQPEYNQVDQKIWGPIWHAQDNEKTKLDRMCAYIKEYYASDVRDNKTKLAMDNLVKDIISYCIEKGYQGTANLYLKVLGEKELTPENAEFISKAVREVIKGYAKRTLLTGSWYGDRALQTIYYAKNGDFGFAMKDASLPELIDVFNNTTIIYNDTKLSINSMTEQYHDLPFKPLTKELWNKEVARIQRQHAMAQRKPDELTQ